MTWWFSVRRQEFVVGGFTEPEGSRAGVGSILVGYYEGSALRFAGKVGTGRGWNAAFGRKLRGLLESIEVDATSFNPPPPGPLAKRAHRVEPHLVAEVQFTEWTGDGKIRHPSRKVSAQTSGRPTSGGRARRTDQLGNCGDGDRGYRWRMRCVCGAPGGDESMTRAGCSALPCADTLSLVRPPADHRVAQPRHASNSAHRASTATCSGCSRGARPASWSHPNAVRDEKRPAG
jgi:hypothetical protein